jgi:hypothetical protein
MKRNSVLACSAMVAAAIAILFSSCVTAPTSVPDGLTAAEIIQRAQEASDKDDFKTAFMYYDTARQRFSEDLSVVCECEYEIAFIYYKQEHFADSKALFETLLARYNQPDARLLPVQYKVLGEKILAKVNDKLAAEAKSAKKPTTP